MYQTDPPLPPQETLPTMYDLPSEDPGGPGLPDEFHDLQPQLLYETFRPPTVSASQIFVGTDLNLYYDVRHPQWYKRPDWFAAVGVPRLYDQRDLRLSYVIWQEGVSPYVVVELLSPGTEKEDLGQTLRDVNQPPTKWEVYEQILRVPYYVVFDRYSDRLQAFQLVADRYSELELTQARIWMPTLELGLGLWQGTFQGIDRLWLRWYDALGEWIPTPTEIESQQAEQERQRAEQEHQRAEQEHQRAEQEHQRAEQAELLLEQERQRLERLAEQLRKMGIDPEQI
ncbi:Uma2 family endonuclease [Kovacikia minuta CCNUW1]|uniref:Uma2 family endonuclease n=1 Tax=Kovacikia minuta TaxID=2931930 RepID=UPI001CC95276|nr:Uma2 family endonuclease [Kovacikia minuta]UBF27348.1 Uma2 family endonuclease [Kovacikia minuta CCNUW1]